MQQPRATFDRDVFGLIFIRFGLLFLFVDFCVEIGCIKVFSLICMLVQNGPNSFFGTSLRDVIGFIFDHVGSSQVLDFFSFTKDAVDAS